MEQKVVELLRSETEPLACIPPVQSVHRILYIHSIFFVSSGIMWEKGKIMRKPHKIIEIIMSHASV